MDFGGRSTGSSEGDGQGARREIDMELGGRSIGSSEGARRELAWIHSELSNMANPSKVRNSSVLRFGGMKPASLSSTGVGAHTAAQHPVNSAALRLPCRRPSAGAVAAAAAAEIPRAPAMAAVCDGSSSQK